MNTVSVAALAIGTVACGWDLAERRIPNVLTFGGACAGLLFHLWIGGGSGLGWSAAGWTVGVLAFFPAFALRGLGAGDVKLLGALGAWLGPWSVIWVALAAGVAGGGLAIGVGLARGYLGEAVGNVRRLLTHWALTGIQPLPDVTLEASRGPRLPYAVPILLGTMVTIWLV